jgi:hypothetical protein
MVILWKVTAAHPMECLLISNYICTATFIHMTITGIVSHGQGALETGPVCYIGADSAEPDGGGYSQQSMDVFQTSV